MTMNNEFLYMPVYRHYFALTPPNPQLDNPRLLNDYIDWYMNVYLEEEEFSWQLVREKSYNIEHVDILTYSVFFFL